MQKYKQPVFEEYSKIIASLDKEKISKPIMTKYELSDIISIRATQLALGAQPFVDVTGLNIESNMELRKVAIQEIRTGKFPFILKRPLPNNKYEYFRIKDMDLVAVQHMLRSDNHLNYLHYIRV